MKAKMNSGMESGRALMAMVMDGGVHKKKENSKSGKNDKRKSGEENSEEMKEYLGKLQELVPFMPKNKRLSKLEVISHVIDYIHDLRETLGLPPCQSEMDCDDDATFEEDDLISSQSFKLSVSKGRDTVPAECSPPLRHPLISISSPRNTESTVESDTSSNN